MAGRPRKFKTIKQLQKLIDKYFKDCDTNKVDKFNQSTGKVYKATEQVPYTIEGLALALGIERKTLWRYENVYEDDFSHVIKSAKQKVMDNLAQRALTGKNVPSVAIFLMKNYGYTDQKEVNVNDKRQEYDLSKLSDEQLGNLESIFANAKSDQSGESEA